MFWNKVDFRWSRAPECCKRKTFTQLAMLLMREEWLTLSPLSITAALPNHRDGRKWADRAFAWVFCTISTSWCLRRFAQLLSCASQEARHRLCYCVLIIPIHSKSLCLCFCPLRSYCQLTLNVVQKLICLSYPPSYEVWKASSRTSLTLTIDWSLVTHPGSTTGASAVTPTG